MCTYLQLKQMHFYPSCWLERCLISVIVNVAFQVLASEGCEDLITGSYYDRFSAYISDLRAVLDSVWHACMYITFDAYAHT